MSFAEEDGVSIRRAEKVKEKVLTGPCLRLRFGLGVGECLGCHVGAVVPRTVDLEPGREGPGLG